MSDTSEKWCGICCTQHEAGPRCPGELLASGPERFGWRVGVTNGAGRSEEFAVLVAPSNDYWRARVLTLPNMLWCVPGARATMKFAGRSAQEVEGRARRYIEAFCVRRGIKCSPPSVAPTTGGFKREAAPGQSGGAKDERHLHNICVRFGKLRPEREGTTGNMSRGGLFVVTSRPMPKGAEIKLTLHMEAATLPLRGVVAWSRGPSEKGREPGMGVQLIAPPALYQHYVERLAAARGETDAVAESPVEGPAVPV